MDPQISVILLAAGESRRMGQPKLLLPWGGTTVLGTVVAAFGSGLESASDDEPHELPGSWEIVVLTGGDHEAVETQVNELAPKYPVRAVYNHDFAHSEMLGSLKTGLLNLGPTVRAAMIGLGDQPQVKSQTVRDLWKAFHQSNAALIIPSFQKRRGHPWLVARSLWADILALSPDSTPRQFLNSHAAETLYIPGDESILQDLDTPEDYLHLRP